MVSKSLIRRRLALSAALTLFLQMAAVCAAQPASQRPDDSATNKGGVSAAVRASIGNGLSYLASQQNRDGSWRANGSNAFPTAMTALAGLSMLAGGNTPTQGLYSRNVSGALTFLLKTARRDGLIAQVDELGHCMHGHGFAMLFLAQCYGMEEDTRRQVQIRRVLKRAIELTGSSQSAAGGWLYTPHSGRDEGSVTVTQVQALRACRNAGIAVPKRIIDDAMAYLDKSSNDDGGIRYQAGDAGPSRPAITAAAIVCWYNAGLYDDPRAVKALRFVEKRLSPAPRDSVRYYNHYYYAHLYMSQAMYLTGDAKWRPYFKRISEFLVNRQQSSGAWDGDHVGEVYGTAIALLILQLPQKNLPIMQR